MKNYKKWTNSEIQGIADAEERHRKDALYWQEKYNEAMKITCDLEYKIDEIQLKSIDFNSLQEEIEQVMSDTWDIDVKDIDHARAIVNYLNEKGYIKSLNI
ncbi:MAG: hypothetical protein CBC71_06125 [Rhodobacteraceae bacterium TMED111]|nr:hypothetical protein [Marinovum sp.]OUV41076.1 MAG: hypothetical protein CBC71_06125 [Rhodobacteraceae bacterium TMED111]